MTSVDEGHNTKPVPAKKRWQEPAIVTEQWLVARAQGPEDPLDPAYADDPFLGPMNVSGQAIDK